MSDHRVRVTTRRRQAQRRFTQVSAAWLESCPLIATRVIDALLSLLAAVMAWLFRSLVTSSLTLTAGSFAPYQSPLPY
jgi:hypothetical protein